MNHDIVCIATPKWFGSYLKSTVQLMEQLAARHNVLYVDYPYTVKDLLLGVLGRKKVPVKQLLGFTDRLVEVPVETGGSVHLLIMPPVLPINWIGNTRLHDLMAWVNGRIASRSIRMGMRRLNIHAPVVINALQPTMGRVLKGALNERLLAYYCYDNIGAAKWLSRHGKRHEEEFIKEADTIIVTSTGLARRNAALGTPVHLVRNGVDFDLFSSQTEPGDAKTRKVIGYLGTVDDRIDIDLVTNIARQFEELEFRFVGRCTCPDTRSRLSKCSNIRLMGAQDKSSLAGHVEQMDVCVIPFVKNEFTAAIYPLKINEYLSRGKPVVSTAFADLSDFHGLIYTANSNKDFLRMLNLALEEENGGLRDRRIRFARSNSWNARAAELTRILSHQAL